MFVYRTLDNKQSSLVRKLVVSALFKSCDINIQISVVKAVFAVSKEKSYSDSKPFDGFTLIHFSTYNYVNHIRFAVFSKPLKKVS